MVHVRLTTLLAPGNTPSQCGKTVDGGEYSFLASEKPMDVEQLEYNERLQ